MKSHLKTVSYVVNKPFGRYYIPARYQYVILRDYFKNNNTLFSLPQGEPAFSKTSIRLRTIIKNLNKNDSLILLSMYVLPEDNQIRNLIFKQLIKKKIITHFIFENIVANNKKKYDKVLNLYRLNKFIKFNN